jgi:hypothetical protein
MLSLGTAEVREHAVAVTQDMPAQQADANRAGRGVFAAAVAAIIALGLPVIWRGAPLGDDFNNCLAPLEMGLPAFAAASWDRLGMIRPARFLEILLTTGVCRALPFGVAIAVPLLLTLAVALLVRGLLRDLDTPAPWPDIGGALWLLQPLGTEAALWPAALHVPLGLVFALIALRFFRRAHHGWAAWAMLGAALCVEQTILTLPVAAFLVAPRPERRRAVLTASAVALVALLAFARWPGGDPRLRVGLFERITALPSDARFYVGFPVVGLGLHSIPLAVQWALPWSVLVLCGGATLGVWVTRRLPPGPGLAGRDAFRGVGAAAVLVLLANAPVVLSLPRQGSPRVFTPTWLILVVVAAMLAARIRWRHPSAFGAGGGIFAAGAILSLALSVSVRLASADFNERAARLIASRVPNDGDVAICGVRRTVTTPAPRGAFAVHELVYDWGAPRALTYYTGKRATFHLAGELWNQSCPTDDEVDVILTFDDLLVRTRR